MAALPKKARKIAHYWYLCGNELAIFVDADRYYIRDGKTGEHPVSPITGVPTPHPKDGSFGSMDYESMGLYYKFNMADAGWGAGFGGDR